MRENIILPLQPIINGRFVSNRIVEKLLDSSTLDMNDIAIMDFTQQERTQFAQLIGYSFSGFGDLSYVDDETYASAELMVDGSNELNLRNEALRAQIVKARIGIKQAAAALFKIHEDDFEV